LPYGFVGFVVGRGNYSVSATTDATCTPSTLECEGFPITSSAGQGNALLYGFSLGGGLDWALTQNVFLRGELEYVQFAPISNISVYIVNARAGAGFKF
jgi:opacity protein-like surface antigen